MCERFAKRIAKPCEHGRDERAQAQARDRARGAGFAGGLAPAIAAAVARGAALQCLGGARGRRRGAFRHRHGHRRRPAPARDGARPGRAGAPPTSGWWSALTHTPTTTASRARSSTPAGCELWIHPAWEHVRRLAEDPDGALDRRIEVARQSGVPAAALELYEQRRGTGTGIARLVEPDHELVPGVEVETDLGTWQVHETPGHAPSHVVLHEPESGLLISGDHLLGRISLFFDYGHTPDPVERVHRRTRRGRPARAHRAVPRRPRAPVPRRAGQGGRQSRRARPATRAGARRVRRRRHAHRVRAHQRPRRA